MEPLGITNLYTTAVKALGITNNILSPSHSIQLSGEGEVNSTYQEAKRRGKYRALFTDPEGESCFSIYQQLNKNKKVTFCKLKNSLSRNFVYNLQTLSSAFLRFCCKFIMKTIFYLLVTTNKPKFVAFLVFVCSTASFIAQISSSENVLKRDAILAPVAKQWIAKDILNYREPIKNCYSLVW